MILRGDTRGKHAHDANESQRGAEDGGQTQHHQRPHDLGELSRQDIRSVHHPGKAAGVSNVLNKFSPDAMVGFPQTAWKPTRPDQLGQPRCRLFAAAIPFQVCLSHFAQPSARIHRSFDKGAKSCTVGICGCRPQKWRPSMKRTTRYLEGRQMKLSITLSATADYWTLGRKQ
jgi:hypothetical protein